MAALWNRAGRPLYFHPVVSSSISSIYLFFSSPILSRRRLNVYHTSTYGVALVQIQGAGVKRAAWGSLKIQHAKNRQKVAILASSHNFVGGTYRKSEKKLVKQQCLSHILSQYDELRPATAEIGSLVWDTPANFNRFRVLAALLYTAL